MAVFGTGSDTPGAQQGSGCCRQAVCPTLHWLGLEMQLQTQMGEQMITERGGRRKVRGLNLSKCSWPLNDFMQWYSYLQEHQVRVRRFLPVFTVMLAIWWAFVLQSKWVIQVFSDLMSEEFCFTLWEPEAREAIGLFAQHRWICLLVGLGLFWLGLQD